MSQSRENRFGAPIRTWSPSTARRRQERSHESNTAGVSWPDSDSNRRAQRPSRAGWELNAILRSLGELRGRDLEGLIERAAGPGDPQLRVEDHEWHWHALYNRLGVVAGHRDRLAAGSEGADIRQGDHRTLELVVPCLVGPDPQRIPAVV